MARILSPLDGAALARYCDASVRWVKAKQFLDEHQDMAKEIEGKIYEALGIGRDLVKPIEGQEEPPLAAVESVEGRAA